MSLETIFSTEEVTGLTIGGFVLSIGIALMIGLFIAIIYMVKAKYSKSIVITLAILPAVVAMVIMMVNGSIGAGIAVAGAFSLVRFRSAPGTAKEIASIFMAMSAGLACGMGYVGFALIYSFILGGIIMIYEVVGLGQDKPTKRRLVVTIPENLEYTEVFNDIFNEYTKSNELVKVKTTNMGSLYKLTYNVDLKDQYQEKNFIDDLRCRNSNLEIVINKPIEGYTEL